MVEKSHEDEKPEENFADMLEAYDLRRTESLRVGDQIEGIVVAIEKETVFVDTGSKFEGTAEVNDLLEKDGSLACRVGDKLKLFVVGITENEIKLSRAFTGIGGLQQIQQAFRSTIPIEGKVTELCKGGFIVDIMKRRAFCPVSQMDVKYIDVPEEYVGQIFDFRITRFEQKGRNIIVSRRVLLEEAQQQAKKQFFQKLQIGDTIEGTVTRLMPYGVFVELIPGLEGMVHISELSWSRIDNPDECVRPGDKIHVKVIEFDPGKGSGKTKIALSAKQIEGDPWERLPETLRTGEKVTGKVTRCAPFGAFVEVAPGIEGLVHISEMSYVKRVLQPEEIVSTGETVSVMVKSIDPQNRKLSLSLRDAEGDPWLEVPDKYRSGQKLTGKIEKKEKFGYLIVLEPGIVGLLPASRIHKASQPARLEKLKQGDDIPVTIEKIDVANRRISLLPADSAESTDWREYQQKTDSKLSPLAEKLQAALAAKESRKKT